MDKLKEERGELGIESTYCIIITLFVLMVMVAFSFLLYQRVVFTAVSNQIAEQVVQLYKYTRPDLTSSVDLQQSDVIQVGLYRYLLKKDKMGQICVQRAQSALSSRLTQTSFARQGGYLVSVEPVSDDVFGRRHFRVEIEARYGLLLEGFLDAVGLQDAGRMSAVVYVEGYDILSYVNTLYTSEYIVDTLTDNTIGDMAESLFSIVKSCISLLDTLFG